MTQRYLMLGAGGTGSALLRPLARYLTASHANKGTDWVLGIMDGDDLEDRNLARQIYDPQWVTMNKATAAEGTLQDAGHGDSVGAITGYLGPDNIEHYVTDGDTVLICVDNFKVRALIEDHGLTLPNLVVINGGNELDTGSCQIWVRRDGQNITPPLTFLHPEIREGTIDRAGMSCDEAAALPGGEQLITANLASALWILTSLMAVEANDIRWTEIQFDLTKGKTSAMNGIPLNGWTP